MMIYLLVIISAYGGVPEPPQFYTAEECQAAANKIRANPYTTVTAVCIEKNMRQPRGWGSIESSKRGDGQ